MNGIDQDASTLQEELEELMEAAQEQPGVAELLEIVDHVNEDRAGFAVQINDIRFIGSTSTTEV